MALRTPESEQTIQPVTCLGCGGYLDHPDAECPRCPEVVTPGSETWEVRP